MKEDKGKRRKFLKVLTWGDTDIAFFLF